MSISDIYVMAEYGRWAVCAIHQRGRGGGGGRGRVCPGVIVGGERQTDCRQAIYRLGMVRTNEKTRLGMGDKSK
jgi:hypothetical protein